MNDQNENKNEHEEIGLYEKLASRTADLLEEGKKTFDDALKKAKEELASAGDFSRADEVYRVDAGTAFEHADELRQLVVALSGDPKILGDGPSPDPVRSHSRR